VADTQKNNKREPEVAVIIGRFQPYHNGHKAIVDYALDNYDYVVILLGSSYQPRSKKNPWTWQERTDMILSAHPKDEGRIYVLPVADNPDDDLWVSSVKSLVSTAAPPQSRITLVGVRSDETSFYLDLFPEWALEELESSGFRHATEIREDYFSREPSFETRVERDVPLTTLSRMQTILRGEEIDKLRAENV